MMVYIFLKPVDTIGFDFLALYYLKSKYDKPTFQNFVNPKSSLLPTYLHHFVVLGNELIMSLFKVWVRIL